MLSYDGRVRHGRFSKHYGNTTMFQVERTCARVQLRHSEHPNMAGVCSCHFERFLCPWSIRCTARHYTVASLLLPNCTDSSQKMKTTKVQECKQDGTSSSWVCSRAQSRIGNQKTPQAMRNGWHDVVLCLTCLYDTVSPVELLHIAAPFFELSREVCCCTCCRIEVSKLFCSFNCNGSVPPAVSVSCINERALWVAR